MNAPIKTYSHKGQTIQTSLSLSEAASILQSKGSLSSFASDMVAAFKRCRISPSQQFFLIKLAMEAKGKISRPQRAGLSVGAGFTKLRDMFALATNKLKFPKIRFDMEDGSVLKISPASRHPGVIYINLDGNYMGKVTPEGIFIPQATCPDSVKSYLQEFSADPAETARVYGQRTGNCCFCCIELTDKRSVDAGYGPICAGNYGLPWGE